MTEMITLESPDGQGLVAGINPDNQQLVSLIRDGVEYMHGGGLPEEKKRRLDLSGWGNSEIAMFPIVGPAPEGIPLGQHGLSRHIPFEVEGRREPNYISFVQRYDRGRHVRNKPGKHPLFMHWPRSFEVSKQFGVASNGINTRFQITNRSKRPANYQFGWHPAFKVPDIELGMVHFRGGGKDRGMSVSDLQKICQSHGAHFITGSSATLRADGRDNLFLYAPEMNQMMLWSPQGSNLVCFEPVTHMARTRDYRVLGPGETVEYNFTITIGERG